MVPAPSRDAAVSHEGTGVREMRGGRRANRSNCFHMWAASHGDRAQGGPGKEKNMKLTRGIASAGVCAVIAGGVVLAGGSSAMAVTAGAGEYHHVSSSGVGVAGQVTAQQPTDPWIADQLAAFYPSAARQLAVFDPWVKDQLALSHPSR